MAKIISKAITYLKYVISTNTYLANYLSFFKEYITKRYPKASF